MAGRFGRVALRALLLPLVVLGVLAMHQMPVPPGPDHHSPAAAATRSAAPVHADPPTATPVPHHDSGDHALCCDAGAGHGGMALHLCLALLVVTIVLAATRRGWWRLPPPVPTRRALRPDGVTDGTRALPWTSPTLPSLQVLRL